MVFLSTAVCIIDLFVFKINGNKAKAAEPFQYRTNTVGFPLRIPYCLR